MSPPMVIYGIISLRAHLERTPCHVVCGDGTTTLGICHFALPPLVVVVVVHLMRHKLSELFDAVDLFQKPDLKESFKKNRHVSTGNAVTRLLTLLMIPALSVWIIFLVGSYIDEPFEQTTTVVWADGSGTWPMRVRCVSPAGCFVSNYLSNFDITRNCGTAYPSSGECIVLQHNEEAEMRGCFTHDHWGGLSVMYGSGETGVKLVSDMLPSDGNGIMDMPGLLSPGRTAFTAVHTFNKTRPSKPSSGRNRYEWFRAVGSSEAAGAVIGGHTACDAALTDAGIDPSPPSPLLEAIVQIESAAWEVEVVRKSGWAVVAEIGGAKEILIVIGSCVSFVLFKLGPGRGGGQGEQASVTVASPAKEGQGYTPSGAGGEE